MRKRSLTAFWPQYFMKRRPPRLGRKVSKSEGSVSPLAEDVAEAAKKAGYYAEIDTFRRYPRSWWDDPGVVLVDIMGQQKTFALHKIAPEVQVAIKNRLEKSKDKRSKRKENIQKVKAQEALKKRLAEKQYGKGKK